MSRRLGGTVRGALQRPWLLLAPGVIVGLALLADVSGRRLADGYALEVTLPGWPLVAAAALLGARFLVRRRGAWRVVAAGIGDTADAGAEADASAASNATTIIGVTQSTTTRNHAASAPHVASAGQPPTASVERIVVRSPRSITLVPVDDAHVEAAGRYARIHASGRTYLAQHSLAELERMLDGARFVRVHQSAIVNLDRIRSLRTADYRDFELLLDDGSTVRLSRNYRALLEGALGIRI